MRAVYVTLVLGAGCVGVPPEIDPFAPLPFEQGVACAPPRLDRVACVIDGDTVSLGACPAAQGERVRLLGIDAPETEKPGQPRECFADEATVALRQLIDQRTIRLEFDWACDDVFGSRTLAYLWLDDGDAPLLVNAWMLERGYARRYDNSALEGDIYYGDVLDDAQARASALGVGLWGVCGG